MIARASLKSSLTIMTASLPRTRGRRVVLGLAGSVRLGVRPAELPCCVGFCCAKTKIGIARERVISATSASESLFFTENLIEFERPTGEPLDRSARQLVVLQS